MQLFYEVVAFLVGLNIGSFLNVVIARVPEGLSIVAPGSRCPRCLSPIRWYDNVPLVSWVLLRAKCRKCGLPISARYPTVELLTAFLALAVAREHPPGPWAGALFVFVCLLVAITYIDLDHWIIPHVLTWPGIVVGLCAGVWAPDRGVLDGVWGALAGFGVFALIGFVGAKVFKKEALGQGDWWLLAMIGAFLGWKALLPVVLLASLQGTVVGVLLIVAGRGQTGEPAPAAGEATAPPAGPAPEPAGETAPLPEVAATGREEEEEEDWVPPKNAVPFGPFLALAALEQLFVGDWLRAIYERVLERLIA